MRGEILKSDLLKRIEADPKARADYRKAYRAFARGGCGVMTFEGVTYLMTKKKGK